MGMKKLFTMLFMALLLSGACQQVEPLAEPQVVLGPDFTAVTEGFDAQTRTALADRNSVVWSSYDQVAVFQGKYAADKYVIKDNYVGSKDGEFSILENANGMSDASFNANVAVYPYSEDLICTPVKEDGSVTSYQITGVTIPSVQTYAADSFSDDSFLMAALTSSLEDRNLNFKNLCGALRLQLKGTATVKKIELKGSNGELLSGDATVTLYADGTTPSIAIAEDASDVVTLDCGEGVQLNEDFPTDFLLSIPPTSFIDGFTAIITDTHGGMTKLTTSASNNVSRSYIHTMPELRINTDDYFATDAAAVHISFDDVVACITNLSTNTYSSLFDEPFFGWLKEMHTEYGARFSLYIYDLAKLAAVPTTYRQEFSDARDWLKFGLHAKKSGYNYSAGTYADAQADWNSLVENIVRITGSHQSIDRIPRLHNFAGNLESVSGMRDGKSGALGFLGADDSRISYHLAEEQNKLLIENSEFTDTENGLIVFRTNYRGERLGAAEGMYEKMEAFMHNPAYASCFSPFVWFTHEPYVYKKSSLTEYARNVEDVCRFASDHGLLFVYPQERIDLDVRTEENANEVTTFGLITQLTAGMTYHPGQVSGPKGILNANSSYNSWSYIVPNDCEIYAGDEKSIYGYLSISVVPAGSSSGVRYRYYSTEDTLPTIENPLSVTAGSTVYISVRKDIVNWAFYTNDLITTSAGTDIMAAVASNQLILRHTFISDQLQYLLILKRCGNRDDLFLGQNFMKVVDNERNSNCWRLGTLDLYKRIGNEFVIYKSGLIISGEWECAIKESGAEDFLGGNAHGDEQLLEISADLDGRALDLSSSFIATGSSLKIARHSLLNRCNTPGDNVIDHIVSYSITPESITIQQTAQWLQDMVIETSYLLMCPIARAYTTSARIEDHNEIIDISYAGHSNPKISGDIGHFSLWGDNFSAEIEYECLEGAFENAFSFISPSSSPAYNKFYYNFVGSNVKQPVQAGHRVTTIGKISYSYNE